MTRQPKKIDVWMPLYIADYLGDTTHLTTEQHGAYFLLLMACWKQGGVLADNDAALAATARLGLAQWRKHRPVIQAFFTAQVGQWSHKRISEELAKAEKLSLARSQTGSRGGRPRKQTESYEKPIGFHSLSKNPDFEKQIETPARVEGGYPVDTPLPSQELNSDSQVRASADVIPLGRGSGR